MPRDAGDSHAQRSGPGGVAAAASNGPDLEAMLLNLAAEQTGFARSSLTAEVRLLDDLNLDSIKAADLIACAAKSAGVAGLVDPSRLANASIAEAAAALEAALAERSTSPALASSRQRSAPALAPLPTVDDGPSWVRHFVIDYVPEAA